LNRNWAGAPVGWTTAGHSTPSFVSQSPHRVQPASASDAANSSSCPRRRDVRDHWTTLSIGQHAPPPTEPRLKPRWRSRASRLILRFLDRAPVHPEETPLLALIPICICVPE